MNNWKPIETANKELSFFERVCLWEDGFIPNCYWDSKLEYWVHPHRRCECGSQKYTVIMNPTHWMPKPSDPNI